VPQDPAQGPRLLLRPPQAARRQGVFPPRDRPDRCGAALRRSVRL